MWSLTEKAADYIGWSLVSVSLSYFIDDVDEEEENNFLIEEVHGGLTMVLPVRKSFC